MQRRTTTATLAVLVLLSMASSSVSEAAAPPPRSARLRPALAKQLKDLQDRHAKATVAGRFAEALQLAEQVVELRQRWQGRRHYETRDAARGVERWLALAGQPKKVQDQLATSVRRGVEGARWRQQGRHSDAVKADREALAICEKVLGAEHPETALAATNLGLDLRALGRFADALALFEKALAIRRKALGEDHVDTAEALLNLAGCLTAVGKHALALPLHQKALLIFRKAVGEMHPRTALAYNNLAFTLQLQGRYAEAAALFRKALDVRRAVLGEQHPDTALGYNNLAVNLQHQGRYAQAQPLFEKALALTRALLGELHPRTAVCCNNLARNLELQGKSAQARALYEKALAVNRQVLGELHPQTATSYDNLAVNLTAQGKPTLARPLFERALAIRRKVLGELHPDTAASYGNLGESIRAQGQAAHALPLHEKALDIRRKVLGEQHPATAVSYGNLAVCLDGLGKHAQAQPLHEKALAIRRKVLGENHPDTARGYANLAENLKAQGQHAKAQPLYERALATCRKVLGEEHPDTARGYNQLGSCLEAQGRHAQAQALYERSLAIRRKALGEDHPDTSRAYHDLAINLWRQGKVREAVRLLEASVPGQEATRFHLASSGFDRALAASFSPRLVLAIGLARLGRPADAFRHAEAGLARGLLDDLDRATGAEVKDQAALQARLVQLDRLLVPLFARAKVSEEETKKRDALVKERRELAGKLSRQTARASERLVLPLERIQKHIPADAALVLWVDDERLGERWACVVRQKGAPAWQRLAGSGKDGAWTAKDSAVPADLLAALLRRDSPATDRADLLKALRRQRLDVLKPHLQAAAGLPAVRRLLVVPTGPMALVPLEVLDEKLVVSYVPSGSVFARLAERHRPLKGSPLLALGDPVFAAGRPGFKPLPGTRREVEAIARLVPGSTKLLGSDASEQELDRLIAAGKLKTYRLLHLATHAVMNPVRPEQSCLILAQDKLPDPQKQALHRKKVHDGRLTVDTILREWRDALDADLVVLSAAETGLGRDAGGDGLLGFAQALLSTGARSLVLSRWKVDDTATALLMVRFYENLLGKRQGLKKGMGRADALAEAGRWLRTLDRAEAVKQAGRLAGKGATLPAGQRPFEHPFYWAGFFLVGDPD
jgi:CHAT domain-containing protein/tetratricopeptide (TPR) repeat protein